MEISDRLAYYQALELAQFKGGFLARTAHELRSPLSSLMGLHQLILTDLCDSPEEERECIAQAYEAAQNFLGLLESVIEVSKFDNGSRTLKIQSFSLSGLLEDVQLAVSLPLSDRNIRLTISDISDELTIQADYDCLRQILIQLLLLAADQKASNIMLEVVSPTEDIAASAPTTSVQSQQEATEQTAELASSFIGLRITDDRMEMNQQETLESWSNKQLKPSAPLSPPKDLHRQWRPQRLSPSFSMLIQQSLLEMMGGWLELAAPDNSVQERSEQGISETVEPSKTSEFVLHCWLPVKSSSDTGRDVQV